jgi:osmotically-inducible protein OsmY
LSGFPRHEIRFAAGMKLSLLCFAAAVGLYACGRQDPAVGQPASQTRIDETRQVEKAADAGKPLSDASLTQIVRSALESDSSLDPRKIDVENRNGSIALHGSVETDEQREKAARIVGSVGGVRNVVNNLTVDPSAASGATAARKE